MLREKILDLKFYANAGLDMLRNRLTYRYSLNNLREKRKSYDFKSILEEIIKDDFNGIFFTPGKGHFHDFYMRDFGWVVKSLVELGYRKEVIQTIDYVLSVYLANNRITTCVTSDGKVYDFPNFAMDSLAYLLFAIDVSDYSLSKLNSYIEFLQEQISGVLSYIDRSNLLVLPNYKFSSLSDHKIRRSSCYDNVMHYLISKEIELLNIKFGKKLFNYPYSSKSILNAIEDNYWNSKFYWDNINRPHFITSDAQIFPLLLYDFNDFLNVMSFTVEDLNNRAKSLVSLLKSNGFFNDIGLRYHSKKLFENYNFFTHIMNVIFPSDYMPNYNFYSLLSYNYQTTPLWQLLGINYLALLDKLYQYTKDDFFKEELISQLQSYEKLILRDKTLFELYDDSLQPYKSLLYFSDYDMIWVSNILWLWEKYIK